MESVATAINALLFALAAFLIVAAVLAAVVGRVALRQWREADRRFDEWQAGIERDIRRGARVADRRFKL